MSIDSKQIYAQYRDELTTARRVSFEHFDKAILSLSAGGLGVSLAFIKDVVPIENTVDLPLLICSWILFAISVLSTLISFVLAQFAIDRQLQFAEEYYVNEKEEFLKKENAFTSATRIANFLAGVCFIIAIVLTVVFTSINLSHAKETKQLADEEKTLRLEEGYVPSKIQKTVVPDAIKGIVPSQMPKVPSKGSNDSKDSTVVGDSPKKSE